MKKLSSLAVICCLSLGPVAAQEEDSAPQSADIKMTEEVTEAAMAEVDEEDNTDESQSDPDSSADLLNSQQQLRQSYTLKRTIDGKVVETKKQTVTLDSNVPFRPTEAGESVLQQVQTAFDSEVLTRVEAFDEARLDFTIADSDRNDHMTISEFITLVQNWQERQVAKEDLESNQNGVGQSDENEAHRAKQFSEEEARQKFMLISGAAASISREDYIREYLLDFDTMDKNDDTLLAGDELMKFRAVIRGGSTES